MRNWIKYLIILVIFAFLGFSREFLFVNINNQLYKLYYNNPSIIIPDNLRFIESFEYKTLYYIKYPLTLIYFLAYFFTTILSVKILINHKKYTIWVVYIYALLLILAGITMAYNYFINWDLGGDEYTFSRWLMGIAQSPLVAFFIIAAGTLYKKLQTETK